jgi:hypothetical protein
MSLRNILPAIALLSFSQLAYTADYRPLSAADRAATEDAFAISMYNPEFTAATRSGKAQAMKDILIGNGAPADIVLTAYGARVETTGNDPEPALFPNTDGSNAICGRWTTYTWYAAYSSPGHPAGWYTTTVCTLWIAANIIKYDYPY